MNWNLEDLKELARVVYARGAQLMVFLLAVFYLLACVIAEQPIGPKTYVEFTYHVIQWQPGRTALTPAAHLSPKPEEPNREQDKPHMNFLENR